MKKFLENGYFTGANYNVNGKFRGELIYEKTDKNKYMYNVIRNGGPFIYITNICI